MNMHEEFRYTILKPIAIHSFFLHINLSVEVLIMQVSPSSIASEAQIYRYSSQSPILQPILVMQWNNDSIYGNRFLIFVFSIIAHSLFDPSVRNSLDLSD